MVCGKKRKHKKVGTKKHTKKPHAKKRTGAKKRKMK